MNKIRKGDDVVVKVGKDSGKRGTVLRVLPDADKLVYIGWDGCVGDPAWPGAQPDALAGFPECVNTWIIVVFHRAEVDGNHDVLLHTGD